MSDCVFPLAFPDYRIAVPRPSIDIDLPDLLPFDEVIEDALDDTTFKMPQLGHAGVLFIADRGSKGLTKYYEYGRYRSNLGEARRKPVPDCTFKNGKPEKGSLLNVLSVISKVAGQRGSISGAFIETPGKFEDMLKYSMERVRQNNSPVRQKYDLITYSCNTFVKSVLDAADVKYEQSLIPILDVRPISFINTIQETHTDIEYKSGKLQVEDNLI